MLPNQTDANNAEFNRTHQTPANETAEQTAARVARESDGRNQIGQAAPPTPDQRKAAEAARLKSIGR